MMKQKRFVHFNSTRQA